MKPGLQVLHRRAVAVEVDLALELVDGVEKGMGVAGGRKPAGDVADPVNEAHE